MKTVLLIAFQSGDSICILLSSYLGWNLWEDVDRNGVSEHSVFYHRVCLSCGYFVDVLYQLRKYPSIISLLRVLSGVDVGFFQYLFYMQQLKYLCNFLLYSINRWITLITFWMLAQSYILDINHTWSWCITLSIYWCI